MIYDEESYKFFPCILQKKLKDGSLKFPDTVETTYLEFLAFRCIEREKEDTTQISRIDFLSYIEEFMQKGKPIKKRRGQLTDPIDDIQYYGVSLFTDKKKLENIMHFPRNNRKICVGYVFQEGGFQLTEDAHVNWWLFEDVDFSKFNLV